MSGIAGGNVVLDRRLQNVFGVQGVDRCHRLSAPTPLKKPDVDRGLEVPFFLPMTLAPLENQFCQEEVLHWPSNREMEGLE